MTVDDHSGTVTICSRGRRGLYADDLGVMVRNHAASRMRRYAWAEISRFADGSHPQGEGADSPDLWILMIVLRTGQKVPVYCTDNRPTPETLTAVRQVAERYRIPSDLTGVPTRDGQPPSRGLYRDPGGQPGPRYWDGTQWSPLLPPDFKPKHMRIREITNSWSALPTADGYWTYAAARARRYGQWVAGGAAIAAVLLIVGLLVGLGSRGTHHGNVSGGGYFFVFGGFAALWVLLRWKEREFFVNLHKAANSFADRSMRDATS